MAEQKEFASTAESQKQLEDFSLGCRVWATLAKNPATRNAGIQVAADNGEVVIGGTAGSTKASELVTQIAETVEGVKGVRSEIGIGTDWYW
jgi:osmotically-inducible protein OsmY